MGVHDGNVRGAAHGDFVFMLEREDDISGPVTLVAIFLPNSL